MSNTHLHRLIGITAATVAGLSWTPGALATPNPGVNQVTDASFDAGPLQAFSRSCGNPYIPGEWNAEGATLITGTSAGVSPHSPNGMLRVNATGGSASQVNQIIDVTSCASDIDGGDVIARFSIWFNSPAAGVTPRLLFQAGDSQTCVGTLNLVGGASDTGYNRSLVLMDADGDPGTWERLSGAIVLPSGTRFLEIQFWALNSEIPTGGVFFDTASITLEPCELLAESGFDSGTGPLQPFSRSCGNPWIPGEWNAEAADLIVGPSAGVSPFFGDGMLRVNATGGVGSQVNQIVDVSEFAEAIDNGNVEARFFGWFNAAAGGAEPRVLLEAGESQTCVGTLVPVGGNSLSGYNLLTLPTTADGNSATWEGLGSNLWLPSGTRFLQYQLIGVNATIPGTGLFFDESSVCLKSALPSFGLPHTALGQAQMGVDGSGNLIVSNIGSSGEDGVEVQLCNGCGTGSGGSGSGFGGPADFGTILCPFSFLFPANGTIAFELDGVWYDGFGTGTNWLRFQTGQSAPGVAIGAAFDEFSVPNGQTIVYQVLSNGLVVHTEQSTQCNGCGLTWGAPIPNSWGAPPIFVNDCAVIASYSWRIIDPTSLLSGSGFQIDFDGGTNIEMPSTQVVNGDVVRIFPQVTFVMGGGSAQTARFLATGTDFGIQGAFLSVFQGVDAAALGQARLDAQSGSLTISNIGSSGQDGLRSTSNDIEDEQFIAYAGSWDPPAPTAGSGSTAMSIGIEGFFGGTEQTLGLMNIGSSGLDGVGISPDFSAIGATFADVAVFQAGTQILLVQNYDLSSGPISAVDPDGLVNPWPTGAGASLIDKSTGSARGIGDPFNGIDTWLTCGVPTSFEIPGESAVLGDEFHIQPLGPSATFGGIEATQILLTDFDTMTLTASAFVPPPLCVGDIDGDDDTDVFDFAIFAPAFGSTGLLPFTGGDFDGDGDVDVFDFGVIAPDFGCGAN